METKTTTGTTASGTTGTTGGTSSSKNLQDELMESARRVWLAGLGALATAGEEGARTFSRLVDRGKDVEHKSRETMGEGFEKAKDSARSTWNDLGNAMDETLTATLHRLGVPTRDEIRTLTSRVEELSAKIDGLRARPAASSAAAADHVVVDSAGNPVAGPGAGGPVVTPAGKTMGGV
ncbi:MAG TPA: phasin family protein [Thermoanaerobaculia bacterium]|nr:phasin family protein [Thermoanaerobaculia bacterium]